VFFNFFINQLPIFCDDIIFSWLRCLSFKYKGETQDCLIGQPYYSLYVYVLKIVTVCISGGMLLAQIMAALTSHTIWYIALYITIGGIFGGILTGFAFVTLLFAFFYKKGIKVDGLNDGIDNLPPVPQKSNRISKVDAIVGIVFSVIFTLVLTAKCLLILHQ